MTDKKHLNSITVLKKIIIPVLKNNDVIKAGIFGSYARGSAKKKSDVDLLIKFEGRKSLLDLVDLVGIKLELEDKLHKKVDILTYNSLHPLLRGNISKEEMRII